MYSGAMILAHHVTTPDNALGAWTWDPTVLVGLCLAAVLYIRGAGVLRRGYGGRDIAFLGGLATLFVALISPLDAVSAALFSAHMVQHLLLILVAAPLLVIASPSVPLALAMPRAWRRGWHRLKRLGPIRRIAGSFRNPLVVWCLHTGAIWIWHLPGLYDAALRNDLVHALEHGSFLGTALLFWAVVLRSGRRVAYGVNILLVFSTALQSGGLGALLTFAGSPLYSSHIATTVAWGLTPLQDQQLAGALMWIPPGFVYLVTMAALFVKWMRDLERRMVATRTGEP